MFRFTENYVKRTEFYSSSGLGFFYYFPSIFFPDLQLRRLIHYEFYEKSEVI